MVSPAWAAAFKRAGDADRVVVPLLPPRPDVTGWYRWSYRACWHKWASHFKDKGLLAPVCGTILAIDRRYRNRLKQRDELPANARICKGCAAQEGA